MSPPLPETKTTPTTESNGQLMLPLNGPEKDIIPEAHRSECIVLLSRMMRCAIEKTPNPVNRDEQR